MKNKKNIAFNIVVILLFMLMIGNAVFWASQKTKMHVDECYTFNFISKTESPSIAQEENFYGNWVDHSYFEDYMTVSNDEAFDMKGVYQSTLSDVHPPLFYMFFETMYSLFSKNKFSFWPGLLLNIIFFVLSIIIYYILAKKIFESEKWALFVTCVYGFGIGSMSIVVFFRMYMQFVLFALLFCYANYMLMNHYNEKENYTKYYVLLFVSSFLGLLTQYYFLIFSFLICCGVWLIFILKKDWKNVLKYAATMGLSLICFYLSWPEVYNDLFLGVRGKQAFKDGVSANRTKESLDFYLKSYDDLVFAKLTYYLIIGLIALCVIKLIVGLKKKTGSKRKQYEASNIFVGILLIEVIVYSATMVVIAPIITARYITPLIPFVYIVYFYCLRKLIQDLKAYKKICIVVFAVFAVITIYGLVGVKPMNLAAPGDEYYELIKPYVGTDAIYVAKDSTRRRTAVICPLAINHKRMLPLLAADYTDILASAYEGQEIDEPIVVYINFEDDNLSETKENIKQILGSDGSMKKISKTNDYFVFVYKPKN